MRYDAPQIHASWLVGQSRGSLQNVRRPVMVATATEMREAEGAAWLVNTVSMLIVLYVVWASSLSAACTQVAIS